VLAVIIWFLSTVNISHFNYNFKNRPLYAGIMPDAFGHLLCLKLCQHNRPEPNSRSKTLSSVDRDAKMVHLPKAIIIIIWNQCLRSCIPGLLAQVTQDVSHLELIMCLDLDVSHNWDKLLHSFYSNHNGWRFFSFLSVWPNACYSKWHYYLLPLMTKSHCISLYVSSYCYSFISYV